MKNQKLNYSLSGSLICADFLYLEKNIKQLIKGKIDYIHIDIMDGLFVPRYGLFPEILKAVRKLTDIPFDAHMMVKNSENYIDDFAKVGVNIYSVHCENNPHLHRTIKKIKTAGMKAGVVLNPATPLNFLDYILNDIDLILLMAINPGIVGHKIIPEIYDKIKTVKEKVIDHPNIIIEIDGGVTFETATKMIKLGANMLVCGTGTIFQPPAQINSKINQLRKTIYENLNK